MTTSARKQYRGSNSGAKKPNGLVSQPRVCLDLFCGAGGFTEGMRQAGFHSLVATDIDAWAGATFEHNHSKHGTTFILGDISTRDTQQQIIDALGKRAVDVVVGGPPCQAFSQVRNHQRVIDDPRNSLYRYYVRVIDRVRPKAFVMENVPGLQNLAGGKIREQILEDLNLNGAYRVASKVVDAAAYGVPQSRLRVLFIGVRADLGVEPRFPNSAFADLPGLERVKRGEGWRYKHANDLVSSIALSELLDTASQKLVTVEQAIGDLAYLRPSKQLVRKPSDTYEPYQTEPQSAYQAARRRGSKELFNVDVPSIRADTIARLKAIPVGGNFRDLPEELSARYLSDKKWGPELGRENLSRKYFFAYRKLYPDHFSWTLNTKADCVFHYKTPRALTVREFARLHSFDDSYHFLFGDRHSRYRQVGNAVPPLLAKAIGKALRALLDEAETRDISRSLRQEAAE